MPVPKYFTHDKHKILKDREKMLGQILAKLGPQDKDGVRTLLGPYLLYFQNCSNNSMKKKKLFSQRKFINILYK